MQLDWRRFRHELPLTLTLAFFGVGIAAAVVGVILNLSVWFGLHVLFGQVQERHAGWLRWYAFDPLALDLKATALAVVAAVLAFGMHRGLIEVVGVMAALGIAMRLLMGA